MPIEKPFTPPPRKPVSEYKTPSPAVVLFSELVNRDDPAYYQNAPVKRGTLYSNIVGGNQTVTDTYPTLYFLRERKFGIQDQLVFWDWATVPDAEDTYNAAVDYVSNAVPYPAFTRVYTIRRDDYENAPTIAIGLPLTGLIGVTIIDGGSGYTSATGTIDGTDVEIEFVISNGSIISGIVTNEGSGVAVGNTIIISGDGSGATAIPIVQPVSCVLTSQKKQELGEDDPLRNEFVRVLRTYETLPGPFIPTTRIDDDGKVVTISTRRNIAANITSAETLITGQWCKTTKKGDDNFVGEESVECRAIPGNPMPSTRLDPDGVKVNIVTTLKDTTLITTAETLIAGVWTKTTKKAVSDLVAQEIVESRAIPGNPIPETQVDKDGESIDVVKTWKDATAITPGETLVAGVWTTTTQESLSDLVSVEVKTSRDIPGNPLVKTSIDSAGDIMTETRTMVAGPPTLVTTNVISGGVWTKTFGEPISELVSWKVVQVRDTQDPLSSYSLEIPDLIPQEFRAAIPLIEEESTVIGTASLPPALPAGYLFAKEAQIDAYTYRLSIRFRDIGSLPKTKADLKNTEQYGGGTLVIFEQLDSYAHVPSPLPDTGLLVVASSVTNLGNGLWYKETQQLYTFIAWPILLGTHVDERYDIQIDIQKQVVDAGTVGGVLVDGTIVEVKPLDKWRSIQISSKLNTDTLPDPVTWFSGQRHSFVPELTNAIIEWAEATCGCSDSFSAMLQVNMNQYTGMVKTRVTEQFYNGPPPDDVTIDQFFPEAHNFGFAWASFCGDSDGNCRTKSGAPLFHIPLCLHDDLALSVGISYTWSFPATTPAVLPHGSYIMLAPHVERWRFQVFRRVLTEVLVP